MNNFAQKIAKFSNSKYMRILTNAFMSVAAISICGSIFSLLKSLPIPGYDTFLANTGLGDILSIPIAVCSDVMALYIALSMGYTMGKEFKEKNPFATALVGLGSFLVLTPFEASSYVVTEEGYNIITATNALGTGTTGALGAKGIFLAILAGILGSRLYIFLCSKNLKIKMPDSVPDTVSQMFEMMIPGGLTFLAFVVVRVIFAHTSFGTAQNFIYTILQNPLMAVGGGLAGVLVYVVGAKFLWCFGVHGGMVGYSAMASIIAAAGAANASALAAGTAVPHPEWALAVIMMDSAVLPLGLAMIIACKSERYKTLSRIALPTSVFNISEPLVFGTPIIMNLLIDIPFVILPGVNIILTMLVMKIGLVALPTGVSVSNVIPLPIAFSILNGSLSGAIWSILLIVMNTLVYLPFVKAMDAKALEEEKRAPEEA